MSVTVYSADIPVASITGAFTDLYGTGQLLMFHVACVTPSSTPGSGLQVTLRWNDGFTDQSDDTIISLDSAGAGVFKQVNMWLGPGATVTMESTMLGAVGAEYEIGWANIFIPGLTT